MPPARKRSASAPPARPEAAAAAAAAPPPASTDEPATLEGTLVELPAGKVYESADEDDGPSAVLEDEQLVGVEEHAPVATTAAATTGSPTRAQNVMTGAAEKVKKLTAAQERYQVDQAKWSALKTDGSETRRFQRPAFTPFTEPPTGFVAGPEHERGGPRPELRKELTHDTHPAIFVAHMGFDRQLFEHMQGSTNEYAAAKGAGSPEFYKTYRPFGVDEIVCANGLLLRNGVSPVPSMALNFKDPRESFVFGDNRVRDVWPGENCGGSERRWIQFRSFFHIQTHSPFEYKKADPKTGAFVKLNYETAGPLKKLEPMLSYCRYKWTSGWRPGKKLSLDEETQGFKGRSSLVTRIKYKREGDGFQADCICDDGYTITFWFRCDHLPCTAEKDVSDRDTRCAWLVDQLPGAWYWLFMDNLFTSWKFGEMLAKRQCLFAGTCTVEQWRGMHGEVVQKAVTKKAELERAKGTLLASVRAKDMPQGCEVICTSYYDDSPFHMMSNVVEGVEVIEFSRKCFNVSTQKHFWVVIKRLSLADLYNHNMNQVDLADQLRGWYRPDGLWIRSASGGGPSTSGAWGRRW